MPFPAIHDCIICEDIRREVNRKATVLGFYGIAPRVGILVKDLGKPVERLAFLFLTDNPEGDASFTLTAHILGPDGSLVFGPPPVTVQLPKGREHYPRVSQLAFGMPGVTFSQTGIHTLLLMVDGGEHYRTSFSVGQAGQDDLEGS